MNDGQGAGVGEFTTGETVLITGGPRPWDYIGYIEVTVNGNPVLAPVIESETGSRLIVSPGTQAQTAYPNDMSGLVLDTFTTCFLTGTGIATANGVCAVEDLQIGDLVLTADGQTVPVKWIGRQAVATQFGPAERRMPVRVRAGALGDGLPVRDLTLTADHALLIDGLLINAGALVNGSSIDYVPLCELGDSYTVYHIETENHDVILAEGAPAETYIDYVARRAFDNYAEYVDLYGEDRTIPEMPHARMSSARHLPPALAARLGIARAA